jgi:arginine N-succinyltransferase
MPRHPLYVDYLPPEAQEVIGRVHADTAPARRLLEQEGLYYEGYVDIFDAGPVLQARISELRALRESALAIVQSAPQHVATDSPVLVANTVLHDFRIIAAHAHPEHGRIALTSEHQCLLACRPGDPVRTMSLNPKKNTYA